jgi:hypothetical protein
MFLNPVINGFMTYGNLKDGSINLYDLFVLNELIAYQSDFDKIYRIESERD